MTSTVTLVQAWGARSTCDFAGCRIPTERSANDGTLLGKGWSGKAGFELLAYKRTRTLWILVGFRCMSQKVGRTYD
jgi:hypothetical protein